VGCVEEVASVFGYWWCGRGWWSGDGVEMITPRPGRCSGRRFSAGHRRPRSGHLLSDLPTIPRSRVSVVPAGSNRPSSDIWQGSSSLTLLCRSVMVRFSGHAASHGKVQGWYLRSRRGVMYVEAQFVWVRPLVGSRAFPWSSLAAHVRGCGSKLGCSRIPKIASLWCAKGNSADGT
jgi:hypothetical protein